MPKQNMDVRENQYSIKKMSWALIQREHVILPLSDIPLWSYDGREIALFPKFDFLYW